MRLVFRTLLASVFVGLVVALGYGGFSHSRVRAQTYSAHVVMVDNEAPFVPAGNPDIGSYGFAPQHVSVQQGQSIAFDNPASNKRPHTVTSITWSGMPPARTLASGTMFDSSPTADQYIVPGSSWTLDTSAMAPGQYLYFCSIHPWMTGSFSVEPAAQ
ncbi:MAG: cupredoxin domain-containing protein [Dehalococcoidia bacterium]